MLRLLAVVTKPSESAPLLVAVAFGLSLMTGVSSAGQDARSPGLTVEFTEGQVTTLSSPPSSHQIAPAGTVTAHHDGITAGTVTVGLVAGEVARMNAKPKGVAGEGRGREPSSSECRVARAD